MQDNSTHLSFSVDQLAELTRTQWVGNPEHLISGVEELVCASSIHASFLENPRYERKMRESKAGVILVPPSTNLEEGKNYLISQNPSLSFQLIIELFLSPPKNGFSGIHPTAVIHPEASLGKNVAVGPHAVIEQGSIIGNDTSIGAGAFIGAETKIGEHCVIHPRVVIRERCTLGHRVIVQPGAVIGSCGFGYYTDKMGKHHALQQLGSVVLEDDVEIGANTTIDRARFKETRIGKGTKIDNLVQIGHQVCLGEDNLIVSQTGIAGSTSTGKNVVMGGKSVLWGILKSQTESF